MKFGVSARSISTMTAILTKENGPKVAGAKAPYAFLYSFPTINGVRPTILLELLGVKYYIREINLKNKEQKQDWFLKANPNGKIPTLAWVDTDGSVEFVSESVAIELFLAEKYDKEHQFSYTYGTKEYYDQLEWILFEVTGYCPNRSNWNYFYQKKDEVNLKKYRDEVIRSLKVLDTRLKDNGTGYLVGNHLSLADITLYPWIGEGNLPTYEGVIESLPTLKSWIAKIGKIDGVRKGLNAFKH